jgi:hypothetical protein
MKVVFLRINRTNILKLKKEGKWTVKEICQICSVSRSIVKRLCSKAKNTHSIQGRLEKAFLLLRKWADQEQSVNEMSGRF